MEESVKVLSTDKYYESVCVANNPRWIWSGSMEFCDNWYSDWVVAFINFDWQQPTSIVLLKDTRF